MTNFIRRLFSIPSRSQQKLARRQIANRLRRNQFRPPVGEPVLNFAGILGLDSGSGTVSGGAVKLLHLRDSFHTGFPFNILYLVSSALPAEVQPYVDWAHDNGAIVVLNQNGVAYPAWAGQESESINRFLSIPLKQADFVLYQSKFSKDASQKLVWKRDAPSTILYNCVDVGFFKPAPIPLPREPWNLLVIGSHWESYRVFRALELLRKCLDRGLNVQLTVAGPFRWEGADEGFSRRLQELGLQGRVERFGEYRQKDAPDIYRRAHILLHLKYKDPCPTVPIEAMACGLPVLGSATGGMPELIGDSAGKLISLPDSWDELLVPDAESLFTALQEIMARFDDFRKAARNRAETLFSHTSWIEIQRNLFRNLLKQKGYYE